MNKIKHMPYRLRSAAIFFAALLQILPLIRNICVTPAASSAFALILRWGIGAGAAVGAVDAVSGATTLFANTNKFYGNSGTDFTNNIIVYIGGGHKSSPNDYFVLSAGSLNSGPIGLGQTTTVTLPNGLIFAPYWPDKFTNMFAAIYGTPTTPGTNTVSVTITSPGNGSKSQDVTFLIGQSLAPTAPTITRQPTSTAAGLGQSALFSVVAQGSTNLAFYWLKDGQPLADGGNISGAQSNILSLSAVTANDAGDYSVLVSNLLGTVTSSNVSLSIVYPPSVISSPASLISSTGTLAQFTVSCGGSEPLVYRWLKNNLSITDGTKYTGSRSNTLNVLNLLTNDAGSYSVVITNLAGAVTSDLATLTVLLPPKFSAQATNRFTKLGSNSVFTAAVSGTAPFTYQWFKNSSPLVDGGNILGANSNVLRVAVLDTNDNGVYSLFVSNLVATATSSNATLTVLVPPSIVEQPTNQAIVISNAVTFSVLADGTAPLRYQWRKGTAAIKNATNSFFALTSVATNAGGNYSVVVTNRAGVVTSSVATLTVLLPPKFSAQATNRFTKLGSNSVFTAVVSGTAPFTYQWFKNSSPLVDGGNILGANSNVLRVTVLDTNDNGVYSLFVSNLVATATSSNATLTVLVPPSIVEQPTNQAIVISNAVTFSVLADGTAPLRYQWRKGTKPIKNATNSSYTIPIVKLTDAATNYTVVVTNRAGALTSSNVTLTVVATAAITPNSVSATALLPTVELKINRNSDGTVTLKMTGVPSGNYALEASDDLDWQATWKTLGDTSPSSDGNWEMTDTEAPSHATRYYRVRKL